jgi:hypothetical protein
MSDRSLLTGALVAAQLPETVPEARMLGGWQDSWSGVGTSSRRCNASATTSANLSWMSGARGDGVDMRSSGVNGRRG